MTPSPLRLMANFTYRYPAPSSRTYPWNLGSHAMASLAIQIFTGLILAMYYLPSPDTAFESVEYFNPSQPSTDVPIWSMASVLGSSRGPIPITSPFLLLEAWTRRKRSYGIIISIISNSFHSAIALVEDFDEALAGTHLVKITSPSGKDLYLPFCPLFLRSDSDKLYVALLPPNWDTQGVRVGCRVYRAPISPSSLTS